MRLEVTVIQVGVANQEIDVLVNAAGTSFRMGSDVAGSI
ncbi:hypothetical protein C494_08902 [Natronorubrum bangense JCM 10635]|uniref:Uncharacterized protein n=1 Tax=Natronorubrum bangense JCM 10635 TaxID=1227500 RepID=L9WHX6_9EURY|nr:hypothetical protein C494_08902 [Natronorubrum bangense JCM 10635]